MQSEKKKFDMKNKLLNKIIRKIRGTGLDTTEKINWLRSQGMKIGKGTVLFSDDILIDAQRPWMVEIGEYCKITQGCIILQHDYSRSVLRRKYGEIIGESQKTIIGNNVFIGVNSVILMGSKIGNNVIIGAGSIVSGKIPDDVVVAGNPAKVIMSIEDYYKKRKENYIEEAYQTFLEFIKKYKREPEILEMGAFWPLFLEKNIKRLDEENIFYNLSGDDKNEVVDSWIKSSENKFNNYLEFKKAAYAYNKRVEKNGKVK